jgi:hypothetical protein
MTLSQMRLSQRGSDDRKRSVRVAHHQCSIDPHDAIAEPPELRVPTAIRGAAAAMHATVHLHNERPIERRYVDVYGLVRIWEVQDGGWDDNQSERSAPVVRH